VRRLIVSILCFARLAAAEDIPRAVPVAEEGVVAPIAPQEVVKASELAGPRAPEMTRTQSGQFFILGSQAALRASIAMDAEEVRRNLLKVLGQGEDVGKYPVVIQLHGRPGDKPPPRRVAAGIFYLEKAFRPQLDVHIGGGVDNQRLRRAVLEMLIHERALRTLEPGPLERPLVVRPWVVDGLLEAAAWANDQGDRRLYESVFKAGGLIDFATLFATRESDLELLDGVTRAAFRASAGALVMALLQQPSGSEGFQQLLGELALNEGEVPLLLRKHFPALNLAGNSMAKWWDLQMANRSDAQLTEVMSVAETEAALERALVLFERDADGQIRERALSEHGFVSELKTQAEREAALGPAQAGLVRLSHRCFPSYRPLVIGYEQVLSALAHQKGARVAAELEKLGAQRARMLGEAARAGDYLDWFEITRARETSGEFNDYLELKRRLDAELARPRTDPLGRYLDDVERLYQRD
jgi:hypothetical protein